MKSAKTTPKNNLKHCLGYTLFLYRVMTSKLIQTTLINRYYLLNFNIHLQTLLLNDFIHAGTFGGIQIMFLQTMFYVYTAVVSTHTLLKIMKFGSFI